MRPIFALRAVFADFPHRPFFAGRPVGALAGRAFGTRFTSGGRNGRGCGLPGRRGPFGGITGSLGDGPGNGRSAASFPLAGSAVGTLGATSFRGTGFA
jgi:hypothetical protein